MIANEVSIIIPAYQEGEILPELINEIKRQYSQYEIIVVDDGSTDSTPDIKNRPGIIYLRHESNRGYGAALKTGIRYSSGGLLVFFDGDGQHDPNDIQKLVNEAENFDMVVGARGKDSYSSWLRRPGKWILKVVSNFLVKEKIPDLNSGLRAIRKNVIMKYLHLMPDGFSFSTTSVIALLKRGYRIKFIPILVKKREGKSTVKPIRDGLGTIMLILRLITMFDPLRIYIPLSMFCMIIGIIYQIINVLQYGFHIMGGTIVSILVGVLIFLFGLLTDQISAIRLEKYE